MAPSKPNESAVAKDDSAPVVLPGHPESSVVHPLVLLSVVDHYNRVAADTNKRVVGVLLGHVYKGVVDITNSFALPFEEDRKDPSIWYFDASYMAEMERKYRKISNREKIVGWYSTGSSLRASDIEIHELLRKHCAHPVFVVVDVNPKDDLSIPTNAYVAVQVPENEQSGQRRTFVHIPSSVKASEAEEIGVEHLLRDIRDQTVTTLRTEIDTKSVALKSLVQKLRLTREYLDRVLSGELEANHKILSELQDIFNLLPNLKVDSLVKSFAAKGNDMMLVIYVSSLVRSIIALHSLVDNQLHLRKLEKEGRIKKKKGDAGEEDGDGDDEKKKKSADKDDKKDAGDEKKAASEAGSSPEANGKPAGKKSPKK